MIFFFISLLTFIRMTISEDNSKCVWKTPSGVNFDLRPLTRFHEYDSYYIRDGDIPCTPEIEPSYSYLWNICADVTNIPAVCSNQTKIGAVLQYLDGKDEEHLCHVIGKYENGNNDIKMLLLDETDPSKGVSLTYPSGEKCESNSGTSSRTATIDIQCSNVRSTILSATEPSPCHFHLIMKSYFGCPLDCPIISGHLCGSHGHCAYDAAIEKPHCYCNQGYAGSDCSPRTKRNDYEAARKGLRAQLGLMIALLVLSLILIATIAAMVMNIAAYRRQQSTDYMSLPESEMTTVKF